MAMVLQPSRVRLTQAIYFGHPPGFGLTSITDGNGITATPNPIITTGTIALGPLSADWTSDTSGLAGPHFDINGHNTTRIFNVKAYGALGNSVADDILPIQAAVNDAQAVKGVVYFPRSAGYYRVSSSILVQDATGISLVGEGTVGSQIAATGGSPAIIVVDVIGTGGSGSCRDVVIKDLGITSGATGLGLRIRDVLHFTLENVYTAGGSPSMSIEGSGNATLINVQTYGGIAMLGGAGGLTNVGPLVANGCQFVAGQSATALVITGDALGLSFNACMFENPGGAYAATVTLDGGTAGVGAVDFYNCHGESNYNLTNTGVDFLIGNTTKCGHVGFYGGNYWGHGNNVNYQAAWLKIVRCKSVVVEGVTVSKLGTANGYNTGMIVTSATFPAAGDMYRFAGNNKDDIAGPLYVDALLGNITGDAQNTNGAITGNTALGVPISGLPAPPWPASLQAQQAVGWHWYNGQAASRNWGVRTDLTAFGDFTILTSSAQTLGLLDIARVQIGPTGNVGLGATAPTRTLDLNGVQRYRGQAAPAVSEGNSGTIYFDSASNKFKASLNGSAYVDVIGSGGVTGSGTTGQLTYWSGVTNLASPSGIYVDAVNNRLGINVPIPTSPLSINGNVDIIPTGSVYQIAGLDALTMNTGTGVVTVGTGGSAPPGISSTLVGFAAGFGATGTHVTAVGQQALRNATGNHSTGVGEGALVATTSGADNTAIGYEAGVTNTTGSSNVFVGSQADATANNLVNAIAIGSSATVSASDSCVLGIGTTKVGIRNVAPPKPLTVNGAAALQQNAILLVNGLNSDIVIGDYSWIRITGPSAGFSVGGFVGGTDGHVLRIYNAVAFQMTIVNGDASSAATNRIKTLTGGNVVLRAGVSSATFVYDDVEDLWILTAQN